MVVGAPGTDEGGDEAGACYVILLNKQGGVFQRTRIARRSGSGPKGLREGAGFGNSVAYMGGATDGVDVVVGAFKTYIRDGDLVSDSDHGLVWVEGPLPLPLLSHVRTHHASLPGTASV